MHWYNFFYALANICFVLAHICFVLAHICFVSTHALMHWYISFLCFWKSKPTQYESTHNVLHWLISVMCRLIRVLYQLKTCFVLNMCRLIEICIDSYCCFLLLTFFCCIYELVLNTWLMKMKSKHMVSFREMISTFYLHKWTTNDACMKSSKSRKLTLKLKFVFWFRAPFKVLWWSK